MRSSGILPWILSTKSVALPFEEKYSLLSSKCTTWDYQTMKDLWVNTIMTDDINLLYEYDGVDDEYDGADI